MSNKVDIDVYFVEKRNRNTKKFGCYLEIEVNPDNDYPCQIIYPLGSNWKNVKKEYPEFNDIISRISSLHEISCNIDEININRVTGAEDLYDIDLDDYST